MISTRNSKKKYLTLKVTRNVAVYFAVRKRLLIDNESRFKSFSKTRRIIARTKSCRRIEAKHSGCSRRGVYVLSLFAYCVINMRVRHWKHIKLKSEFISPPGGTSRGGSTVHTLFRTGHLGGYIGVFSIGRAQKKTFPIRMLVCKLIRSVSN